LLLLSVLPVVELVLCLVVFVVLTVVAVIVARLVSVTLPQPVEGSQPVAAGNPEAQYSALLGAPPVEQ
jgi:biopolymer transport protein ExbD